MTLHVCSMGFDCPYGHLDTTGKEPTWYCSYPSLGLQIIWEDLMEVNDRYRCPLMAEDTLLGEILGSYEDSLDECDEMLEEASQ